MAGIKLQALNSKCLVLHLQFSRLKKKATGVTCSIQDQRSQKLVEEIWQNCVEDTIKECMKLNKPYPSMYLDFLAA